METKLPTEGTESFHYLSAVRGIVSRYYDGEFYVVGNTTSCRDLEDSFVGDNRMIGVLSIAFVILVLIFSFKSVGLPILLILIIQGSIWMNFSTPFLFGKPLFFLTYLIISSIQMGANIDYAIVISSHYLELKETLPLREAMIETLNQAFPTIITSGTMLASAGMIIGFATSNETVSTIGIYLGVGTLISIFLVMCVLPSILLLGDILISKTSFNLNLHTAQRTQHVGAIRIDGKVRGTLNGYIDAEVHGTFRGTVDAVIAMGNQPTDPPDGAAETDPAVPQTEREYESTSSHSC